MSPKAQYIEFNGEWHKSCCTCKKPFGAGSLDGLASFFFRDRTSNDGLMRTCKTCSEYRKANPNPKKPGDLEAMFWEKVIKANGCWFWTGAKNKDGYGLVRRNGKTKKAHRVAWDLLAMGPLDGFVVDHKCGNPACVRPDHLRKATRLENSINCRRKVTEERPYRGITRSGKKWMAQISINKKKTYLGVFNTPEEAATAYDRAASEHFGEFAVLNFEGRDHGTNKG